jgi:Tol biopolymer transport system component
MVTFNNVADYGSRKQWAVVVYGDNRYTAVSGNADVIPGSTVVTGGTIFIAFPTNHWGWTWPTWKSDGSQISYIFGIGTPYTIAANSTTPGEIGAKLFNVEDTKIPSDPDFLAWAPPGPRANQLLYTGWDPVKSGETIYLATAGSTSPGTPLVYVDEGVGRVVLGMAWLPDSSGFLYSKTEGYGQYANIYEYRFASNTSTNITGFSSGYPRRLSISPDGTRVVYEYQDSGEWTENNPSLDLWMMNRNGSGRSLFVANGRNPAWSPQDLPTPAVLDKIIYLPGIHRP